MNDQPLTAKEQLLLQAFRKVHVDLQDTTLVLLTTVSAMSEQTTQLQEQTAQIERLKAELSHARGWDKRRATPET